MSRTNKILKVIGVSIGLSLLTTPAFTDVFDLGYFGSREFDTSGRYVADTSKLLRVYEYLGPNSGAFVSLNQLELYNIGSFYPNKKYKYQYHIQTQVPEISTWLMLFLGLGSIYYLKRWRT